MGNDWIVRWFGPRFLRFCCCGLVACNKIRGLNDYQPVRIRHERQRCIADALVKNHGYVKLAGQIAYTRWPWLSILIFTTDQKEPNWWYWPLSSFVKKRDGLRRKRSRRFANTSSFIGTEVVRDCLGEDAWVIASNARHSGGNA